MQCLLSYMTSLHECIVDRLINNWLRVSSVIGRSMVVSVCEQR